MSLYDFGSEFSHVYQEQCVCGEIIEVSAQKDNGPSEYTTEIYVKCKCGASVEFELPVN